jgi:hypothetical protein
VNLDFILILRFKILKNMKKLLILIGFLMLSGAVFGQAQEKKLPEIKGKTFVYRDLSYKLNDTPNYDQVKKVDADFLYGISDYQLEEMKSKDMKSYEFYTKAKIYYKTLSDKVKAIYTANEIWDIYIHDQGLKSRLQTVK